MLRYLYLIAFFVLISHDSAEAQQSPISISEAGSKIQKEYKEIGKMIRKGEDRKKVLKKLSKAIKKNPHVLDFYARRGSIYYKANEYDLSLADFSKVIEMKSDFAPEIYYSIGLIHFKLKDFEASAINLKEFIDSKPKTGNRLNKANRLFRDASFAAEAIKNPVKYEPVRLNDAVNSTHLEYYPSLFLDQSGLIFTRRENAGEDFYFAQLNEYGEYTNVKPLNSLNTPVDEGASCISPDGNMIIYAFNDRKQSYGNYDLFYSVRQGNTWSPPYNMGPMINTAGWESQPSISGDGQRLYFASRRTGNIGGSDIYMSKKDSHGAWTKAVNLGEQINTRLDDESPFIHPDDESFYFRSNGRAGMGGYDLYFTRYDLEMDKWTPVTNLGYPINTENDEGGLTIDLSGNRAYFTSDQEYKGDQANLDLFYFELPSEYKPKPTSYISIKVIDQETKLPLQAKLSLTNNANGKILSEAFSDKNGDYIRAIAAGKNYNLTIDKEAYVFHSENFKLEEVLSLSDPYLIEVALQKIPKKTATTIEEKPIVLNNIFFETGSAILSSNSNTEIQYLYKLLSDNTNLKIKIVGHTDNVGTEEANLLLSKNRAKAVLTALLNKGIMANRLSSDGMGESAPIADNDTPEGRDQNRRTEFYIVK